MWSLITICGALLVIQSEIVQYCQFFRSFCLCYSIKTQIENSFSRTQNHHTRNFIALLFIAVEAMYPFAVLFIACELCQHVNGAFNECSDIVDQFGWYRFPADVKQILPMILSFTQQPVIIKCFGSITCDRETFKYVSGHRMQFFPSDFL